LLTSNGDPAASGAPRQRTMMLESDGAKSPLSQAMEFRDYYQTLGLQRSASADEIR
jgi:hypothetical protein